MHIWSLHPKYLDRRELKATWEYGLRALTFLTSSTGPGKFSPELSRFRTQAHPRITLVKYLRCLAEEAARRGIKLDTSLLPRIPNITTAKIPIDAAQLDYEWQLLIRRQLGRSPRFIRRFTSSPAHDPNPLFYVREGGAVAAWQQLVL